MASMVDDELAQLKVAQQVQDALVLLVSEVPSPQQAGFGTTGRGTFVDYEATFGSLVGDADGRELLATLARERAHCVRAFGEGDEAVAIACGCLRPALARLAASVRAAGAALDACGSGVSCAWTSPLEAATKKGQYRSYEAGSGAAPFSARAAEAVAADAVAVHAREAVCRERLAHAMAQGEPGSDAGPRLKKAAALRRGAAGLWEALSATRPGTPLGALDALPAGAAFAVGDNRPPEATRGVCSGRALVASASAQRMAVASALASGALPDSLGAKLCGGVVDKLDAGRDASRDAAPAHHARCDPAFFNAVAADAKLFGALRCWFSARQAHAEGAYGLVVAWYASALKHLEPRVLTMGGAGAHQDKALKTFKAAVARAHAAALKDNNSVYYETVPPPDALRNPPSLKTMAPEPPVPAYDDPVALKAPAMSDEDLARKLQAELNAEG